MLRFLNRYKPQLSKRKDYENSYKSVSDNFAKLCDFRDINDALISNESNKVAYALGELFQKISFSSIDKYELEISILIHILCRIILQIPK